MSCLKRSNKLLAVYNMKHCAVFDEGQGCQGRCRGEVTEKDASALSSSDDHNKHFSTVDRCCCLTFRISLAVQQASGPMVTRGSSMYSCTEAGSAGTSSGMARNEGA